MTTAPADEASADPVAAPRAGSAPADPAAFRRLWGAAGLANLGDGVGLIAVPLLATTLTRDPVLVGALSAVLFVPYLVLGVPAGVLVDRVERRTAMLVANLARATALAGLCAGLVADAVTIGWLYVLVVVLGAAECVYDAAAEGAVPRLVSDEGLDGANARLQGTVQLANSFLGAPVGALLFAVAAVLPFGVHAAMLVLATLLVASLPRLSSGRDQASVRAGVRGLHRQTREGVVWLARHRALRTLALVSAGCAFALQLAQATIVLFALEVLHLPEAAFGAVTMATALGALAGMAAAPRLAARHGRIQAMLGCAVLEVACLAAMGTVSTAAPAAVVLAGFAAAVGAWNVLSVSLRQQLVPEHLFGRVHGAWRTLVWGALPLGAWLGGVVAGGWGLRAPWFVGAGVLTVVLVVGAPALVRVGRDLRSGEPVA